MRKNISLVTILAILCFSSVLVNAQTNSGEKLNLSSKTIADTKVYYEKSFEPNLPFFEDILKTFLTKKDSGDKYESEKDQILADINKILGINEPDTNLQNDLWDQLIGIYSSIDIKTICLAKQSTIKEYLHEGGELPYFTYDKNSNEVIYDPMIEGDIRDIAKTGIELVFPIESEKNFERTVAGLLTILYNNTFGTNKLDVAAHEIAEISLVKYIIPKDPYWRWFTDGTANAVTYEILKKYADQELLDTFVKEFDTDRFSDIKNQINLRYWMTGEFCILVHDAPTKQGEKYSHARYSYSTLEVRKLIDEYGIDCISKIVNEIKTKESRTGNELIKTIKDVTGEDMDVRLAAYQDFKEPQDAIARYEINLQKAFDEKDFEETLFNWLRRYELRITSGNPQVLLTDYKNIAVDLYRIGHEQEADEVMNRLLKILSKLKVNNVREAGLETLCMYALECQKHQKARTAAKELLKLAPDNVAALTVQSILLLESGQLDHAKETAAKILSLSKNEKSLYNSIATQVITFDPNNIKANQ